MRINLLPVEERPLKQSAVRWDFIAMFLGIILLIVVNALAYLQSVQIDALQHEYAQLMSYQNMLIDQQRQIAQVQARNQELKARLDHYRLITDGHDPAQKELAAVISSVPEQVWLEAVQVAGMEIVILGYTAESPLITRYIQNLELYGYSAEVGSIEPALGGRLFSFAIKAQRRE